MTDKILRGFYRALPLAAIAIPSAAFAVVDSNSLGLDVVNEPLGLGSGDIRLTIARIINVALGLLGIVAVVIILLGGFTWMTAAGNEEKVDKARKLIVAGIIGLAIILSAYAIARFVINSLVTATTQS